MIRTFDICINAAHPEVKLYEAATFISSPSTAFVRGVPPAMGSWRITAVRLAAAWPDGSIENTTATQTGDGVWAATLQGMDASGRVENGLQVLADGVDETGAAVTGYVLGIADLAVYTRDATIDVDGQSWYVRLFDSAPTPPHKGDAYISSGYMLIYDGAQWITIGGGGGGGGIVDDAVTRTSSNAVRSSGIWSAIWGALTALPTGFTALYDWVVDQLTGKADKSEMSVTTANDTATITLKQGTSVTVLTQHQPLPAAVAPSTSAAQGAYADARDTGTALAGKQPSITASGILKGNGSGGVTAAFAGTDYQSPLTIDATPTASSTNPVQSGGVKTALDGKVSGALGSGGWVVTSGQRDYVFASDALADDDITIARIAELRYAKHVLTTPAGSATLLDRADNLYVGDSTFTSCTFTLPPAIDGQVRDFLLDVDNSSNGSDFAAEFYGLGTAYALAVNADEVTSSKTAGEVLAEMTVVEAGTRARFYFTEANQTQIATVGNESVDLPILTFQRMTIAPTTVQGGA